VRSRREARAGVLRSSRRRRRGGSSARPEELIRDDSASSAPLAHRDGSRMRRFGPGRRTLPRGSGAGTCLEGDCATTGSSACRGLACVMTDEDRWQEMPLPTRAATAEQQGAVVPRPAAARAMAPALRERRQWGRAPTTDGSSSTAGHRSRGAHGVGAHPNRGAPDGGVAPVEPAGGQIGLLERGPSTSYILFDAPRR